ncbi:hypothetical protein M404DRAFT_1006721, partial [Pisolithus tinctorius Marx 270]
HPIRYSPPSAGFMASSSRTSTLLCAGKYWAQIREAWSCPPAGSPGLLSIASRMRSISLCKQ